MNLYEIDRKISEAYEAAIDPETGEIVDQEAYAALDQLEMEIGEKIEGLLLWIKNLRAHEEELNAEKMAFEARQQAAKRKADSLEKYVSGVLDGQKFSTTRVEVRWRKSVTVEYTGNMEKLPGDMVRKKLEINKKALKDALDHGIVIPGARIVTKNNMQIK